MRSIAYLISRDMLPGGPNLRVDAWELEHQLARLAAPCEARGLRLDLRVWDDLSWDPADHAAVVLGTPWDYARRADAFLARLEGCAAVVPVLNPVPTVRWNLAKTYLRELAAAGAPSIPTVWAEAASPEGIRAAFDQLGADVIVVKPVIGAGAWRQAKIARGAPLPEPEALPPAAAMIQPFLPSAASDGEISLIFCGDELSHAVRKRPAAGDYRVQSAYGGREEVATPSGDEIAVARQVLACSPGPLLYARVDLVRNAAEEPVLMELEVIEPYLYPDQGPELGERFAARLDNLLRNTEALQGV